MKVSRWCSLPQVEKRGEIDNAYLFDAYCIGCVCTGIKCPFNMVHSECGSPCTDTCSNQEGTQVCADHCVDGCVCPPGKTLIISRNPVITVYFIYHARVF